jgi:hypothetical protein
MDEPTKDQGISDPETGASEPIGGSRRRTREYRYTGVADLLPDWLLPEEGKQHVRAARRELLLAARSMIDGWIDRNDRGITVRRSPTKIEID